MTDRDIIKALECCCKNNSCEGCPLDYFTFSSSQCASELAIKSLDLINRQKAEIERLKIENQSLRGAADSYKLHYNEARTEAVKEFAERLKKIIRLDDDCQYDCVNCYYECGDYVIDIDNLVKEMTGENND